MVKIGEELELRVYKFAELGKTICLYDSFIIFVEGAIPGELIKVKIWKVKKNYAEGRLISILEHSPLRIEPRCSHFGICGGCKWQHLSYEKQLQIKHQTVIEAAYHIGGFKDIEIPATIPSSKIYEYRSKMEFSFSNRRWSLDEANPAGKSYEVTLALGLHAPSQYSSVIDIKNCYLQRSPSSEILNFFREICLQNNWEPWDSKSKKGYLKHLVIKIGENTNNIMVNLVTSYLNPNRLKIFNELIRNRFPEITTMVNSISPENSQNLSSAKLEILYGEGKIYEKMGDYIFEIKPNAFFQPNTLQAESLYRLAVKYSEPKETDIVYDLYCGVGTVSIFFSPYVKRVIGIDLDAEAIESALNNCKANNIYNCEFFQGDVMKLLTKEFIKQHGKPDIIIVDPPRPGLHKRLVEFIKELESPIIIYISCNPMTQMRDLAMFKESYRIEVAQPVDMFPQTYHVESIAKLTRIR
ncbi:MAG: 23S rRNA (uracil(1939)-C(5))-methyltransferase RlmD [Thermodesulfovibrionales bacterium]|nr:23S rRNA (uracil(1939)-C(5))-methyltransferase RlmD [Thermodesulfovibrionales bacterium]